MIISGMSGTEIYCLGLKGLAPGEITVGNSVYSLGLAGAVSAFGRQFAGGEIQQITEMISEGRHAAITRMEQEAQKHGAAGVSGVVTELRTLAGFTEFLSQGTAVHFREAPQGARFFSSAASGVELYCHLDAGYIPMKFCMGNIAYALGIGRGIAGSVRTLARGEVVEFSKMYNDIRHVALERLKQEAARHGANAVVDVDIRMIPHGPGTVELLMTGTGSYHPRLPQGHVVTSELRGEELWNLAKIGYVPHELVMATSVFSLGIAGGIGALFQSISKGELPDVTKLIYQARENCLELVRQEAQRLGAERVIGNRLQIRELSPGLVEVVAVGTAVRPAQGFEPATPQLIPQAVIADSDSAKGGHDVHTLGVPNVAMELGQRAMGGIQGRAMGGVIGLIITVVVMVFMCIVSALINGSN